MALVVKDRVKEQTSTTGTSTLTLGGTTTGFQTFSVIGDGSTTYYAIVHQSLDEWEVGLGTYTASGTTLSRDTILDSSNSGSAVNFSAGTKDVFVTYPAGKSVYYDSAGGVTIDTVLIKDGLVDGRDVSVDGTKLDTVETNADVTDATNVLAALVGQEAVATGFTGTLDGVLGGGTPAAATVTTLTVSGVTTVQAGTALLPSIVPTGDTNTGVWFPAADTLAASTAGTERMRIDSSGDMIMKGGRIKVRESDDGNDAVVITRDADEGYVNLYSEGSQTIEIRGNGNSYFNGGNVGIGTSSPSAKLHVQSIGSGTVALFGNSVGNNYLDVTRITTSPAFASLRAYTASAALEGGPVLLFRTTDADGSSPTERMRIDSSGNVGIGTSSPNSPLHVSGDIFSSDGIEGQAILAYGTPHSYTNGAGGTAGIMMDFATDTGNIRAFNNSSGTGTAKITFITGGGERVRITETGNVGIGTSSPVKKLHVDGPALATIGALTDGATITPDFDSNQNFSVTLAGNRTLANPTNIDAGQTGSIFITQDGTGSRTLSFGSDWDFAGGTAPTLSTAAGAVDRIDYIVRTGTSIHAVATLNLS
jgi:hypothetical protein